MDIVDYYITKLDDQLAGKYGIYQQREAVRDIGKRKCEIINGVVAFNDGVARWTTNNQAVPMDCAVQFKKVTDKIDLEKQKIAIDGGIQDFLARYKAPKPTAEDMAEMDANFEAGEKIVDIFTGEVIYTSKGI